MRTALASKSNQLAELARQHFAVHGPRGAPPLPLDYHEREDIKRRGMLGTILGLYARSLEASGYDLERHPSFYDYACGVMASPLNVHPGLATDPEMLRRFPPRELAEMGPGLYWRTTVRR